MFLPRISLADHILKVCLTNPSTKKFQENKLTLYQCLKKHEFGEELHEININFSCNSKTF